MNQLVLSNVTLKKNFNKLKCMVPSDVGLLKRAQPKIANHGIRRATAYCKEENIMQMSRTGVIPLECHDFYEGLPSSGSVPDKLCRQDTIEDANCNDTRNE